MSNRSFHWGPNLRALDSQAVIVAEISANHGQNFQRALRLIGLAKACGASAVKFQAYTPDTMTIDCNARHFRIRHPKWGGQTLYSLYQKAYTPWKWFKRLKAHADREGILFFSTAFDATSVAFLEDLGVAVHKIASFELIDLPLIERVAKTRKPLILSTGMSSLEEIAEAVRCARRMGAAELMLLKCVSCYPARPEEMNLRTIRDMSARFRCPVGLSDHSLDPAVSIAAVSMGACMIEKHFTLSRRLGTPDSFFSLEPNELKNLARMIRTTESAMGKIHYGLTAHERGNLIFRRSIFAVRDIRKDEPFTCENVRSIRPAGGLPPKYLKLLVGRRARRSVKRGRPITQDIAGI